MFKKIALVVVVLVGALLAYAATRPDTMHVRRAASIKASPEKIFLSAHQRLPQLEVLVTVREDRIYSRGLDAESRTRLGGLLRYYYRAA